jgi:hypothetical protein
MKLLDGVEYGLEVEDKIGHCVEDVIVDDNLSDA